MMMQGSFVSMKKNGNLKSLVNIFILSSMFFFLLKTNRLRGFCRSIIVKSKLLKKTFHL